MNVIVICCDTFRADIIGSGKKLSFVNTPHLDALAAESVVFDRCFAEGLPTIPLRRCVFTGKRSFPWQFETENEGLQPAGAGWHPIPHELDTLAEILHDSGHVTGLVSDVYHMFKPTMNFTRGFLSWRFIRGQENDSYRSGPLSRINLAAHTPEGNPDPADHPTVTQYLLNALDRQEGEQHFMAASVFRAAAQWVEDNAANKPFFLWVDSFSPHEMWDPPRHYADAYFKDDLVKDYIHHSVFKGYDPTPAEIERTKALYYGYVTFVDRWIGHLLESIDRAGVRDDTVLMFVSDHGTQLMDRDAFGKGARDLFPFNTQMNWTIRHPDGPRGKHVDAWVQDQDIFSTILSVLDVDHNPGDGQDAWLLAQNDNPGIRDHAVTGWGSFANVRDDHWSAHMNVTDITDPVVYDLETDPDEQSPLSSIPNDVMSRVKQRVEDVAGDRPVSFNEYKQRFPARSLRTFSR
ncbi:MAG: sulfatase [Candidatus Latescibacterota bacterium]|nr:sulfatase [Candidatus Latescibacterota bacterium]